MGLPALNGVNQSGLPPSGDFANAYLAGKITAVGPGRVFGFFGPTRLVLYASINTALTTTAGSGTASVVSGTGLAAGQAINSTLVPPGTTWATFSGTSGTLALPTQTYPGTININSTLMTVPVTAGLLGATVTGPGIPANTTVLLIQQAAVLPSQFSPGIPGIIQLSNPATAAAPASPQNTQIQFDFALAAAGIAAGTDSTAIFTGATITYSGTVQLEHSFDGGATWIVASTSVGQLAQFAGGQPISLTFGEPEKVVLYRLNCIAYTSGTINYRMSATGGAAMSLSLGSPI